MVIPYYLFSELGTRPDSFIRKNQNCGETSSNPQSSIKKIKKKGEKPENVEGEGKPSNKPIGKMNMKKAEKIEVPDPDALLEFLPQKPVPVLLSSLKNRDREQIITIYREGMDAKLVKRTIRKRIRRYLNEHTNYEQESRKTGKNGPVKQTKKKEQKNADMTTSSKASQKGKAGETITEKMVTGKATKAKPEKRMGTGKDKNDKSDLEIKNFIQQRCEMSCPMMNNEIME